MHPLKPILVSLTLALCAGATHASQLIVNALVIDGSGSPARTAAVRIKNDRIVAIGALRPQRGEEVIDAKGLVLAPGFIDTHNHHDDGIFDKRDVPEAVSQGITTIAVGQDGESHFPLKDFFSRLAKTPVGVNIASFAGHGTVRSAVMGEDYKRPATAAEIGAMQKLLAQEMRAGALGLSSGLEYEPGSYSSTAELIALAQEAGRYGGRYISHMRSEDVKLDEAIDELVSIGQSACLPVQISHFKVALITRWGEAPKVLQRLDAARAQGIDVTADVYPYEYWQSTLKILFPERDYTNRATAEVSLKTIAAPADLIMSEFEPDASLVGKSVAEIAALRNTDAATTLMSLIQEAQSYGNEGGAETVIAKSMSNEDIAALIRWPHTNISSDGSLNDRHPRGAGSFTRVLRVYVREQKALTLEQAIHKMTALAAVHAGIADRGTIRVGAFADMVLIDPQTVSDRSTFKNPEALSVGVERVWVNGRTVWHNGATTNIYAGRTVARSAKSALKPAPASSSCGQAHR